MKLEEYKVQCNRTCPSLGTLQNDNNHMLMGMVTEVGELVDVFKRNQAYGKAIDWVNVGEEVADIMWYLVNFCTINNIDLEEQLSKNINKLKVRFPDKFDTEKALNRDLDSERVELEGK